MPKYWEDYAIGETFVTPGRTIGEDTINILAGLAGFTFSFFWSKEAARKSVYGSRIAPGGLVILYMGGLEEASGFWDEATVVALVGLENVRIKKPVRAGDTIHFEGEVTDKRQTRNLETGLIIHRSVCRNQDEQVVAEAESVHLVRRKSA